MGEKYRLLGLRFGVWRNHTRTGYKYEGKEEYDCHSIQLSTWLSYLVNLWDKKFNTKRMNNNKCGRTEERPQRLKVKKLFKKG